MSSGHVRNANRFGNTSRSDRASARTSDHRSTHHRGEHDHRSAYDRGSNKRNDHCSAYDRGSDKRNDYGGSDYYGGSGYDRSGHYHHGSTPNYPSTVSGIRLEPFFHIVNVNIN